MSRHVVAVLAALLAASLFGDEAAALDPDNIDGVWWAGSDRGAPHIITITIRSDDRGRHFGRMVMAYGTGSYALPESEAERGSSFRLRTPLSPPFDIFSFQVIPGGAIPQCALAPAVRKIVGAWGGSSDYQCFAKHHFSIPRPGSTPPHQLPPGTPPPQIR